MSADGMLEVSFAAWGNAVALMALLVSIISGYLVVAFMAGKKMLSSQVRIVTFLYLLLTFFILWGTGYMIDRAAIIEEIAYELAGGELGLLASEMEAGIGIVVLFGVCIIASLKFMWDIRHPKIE